MSLKSVIAAASVGTLATTVAASCEVGEKAIFHQPDNNPEMWLPTKGYWTPGPDGQWNGEWTEVNDKMLFPNHVQGEVLDLPTPFVHQYYIRLEPHTVGGEYYEVISESGEISPQSGVPTRYDMHCESSPGYSVPAAADVPSSFVEVRSGEDSSSSSTMTCNENDDVILSCRVGDCTTQEVDGEQVEGFWAEDADKFEEGKENEPIFIPNSTRGWIEQDYHDGNYQIGMRAQMPLMPPTYTFGAPGDNPYTNKYTGEETTFFMACGKF